MLKAYPGVLTLRVRMPIVADLTYPRNFITKIIKYDKVRMAVLCCAVLCWLCCAAMMSRQQGVEGRGYSSEVSFLGKV